MDCSLPLQSSGRSLKTANSSKMSYCCAKLVTWFSLKINITFIMLPNAKIKLCARECDSEKGNHMKIKLPKDIVGVKFPRICTIEMNDFDIDLLLPSLFFTILAQGRGKARQTNDPEAITQFIDALAQHSALEGFRDAEGRRVLERLVRTTLITTGSVGRSHINEQITSIVPYTILAHKPGFPVGSRQRGADTFIYQVLREHLSADDALRSFVKTVFGRGVIIGSIADLGGSYDGKTKLDTLTRLSIAFLEDEFKI